jgi:uncharacterized membrane protein YfcA
MSLAADALIFAAGFGAGTVNTIVGSGSLITFPTLLSLGYSPLVANVSNTLGLVPGSISGAYGYRRELKGQRSRMLPSAISSLLGALLGGILLVNFPNAFQTFVPVLIIIAVILVVAQPSIAQRLAKGGHHGNGGLLMYIGIFLTAIYGGYFGAAQGVILLAILGIGFEDTLQRLNGLKNVIAAIVNGVAAVLFLFVAHIAFVPALIIAVSSAVGAQFGAKVGRKIPAKALRGLIVVVGLAVATKLLFF